MKDEYTLIRVPFLGVNDQSCNLVSKLYENDSFINNDDIIAVVETTKTAIDVVSESDGYIYWNVEISDELSVNAIMGILSNKNLSDSEVDKIFKQENDSEKLISSDEISFTKKAELIAKKNNILLEEISKQYPSITKIKENHVLEYIEYEQNKNRLLGFANLERVAIIGGAGGGGALIIIDSLLRSKNQSPVAVLDKNPYYHNKTILGVPVVGTIDKLGDLFANKIIDSVVIAFNGDLKEREKVFNEIKSMEIPFANVIDDSSNIRSLVEIGEGNVILGNTYIGACSFIGDNNFISSNVCLEHGNILGSHCAFGPNVTTSGNVTIGNRIRFATGIVVEPNIKISSDVVISSGAVIRENIDSDSVLMVEYSQKIKSLNKS